MHKKNKITAKYLKYGIKRTLFIVRAILISAFLFYDLCLSLGCFNGGTTYQHVFSSLTTLNKSTLVTFKA